MNYDLVMPTGTLFKDGENICCCDLISYEDFENEIKWIMDYFKYDKGIFEYYEGQYLVYKKEVK